MADKYCRDIEGWGPVSPIRDFDLTPCFEEGVLQSTLLGLLLALGSFRIFSLSKVKNRERSRKSRWTLYAKLVRLGFDIFIFN
jgi:hypothetical protein